MQVEKADLVDLYNAGEVVVITTNGTIKKNGNAVMGRGCAKQFADLVPELPAILGAKLQKFGLRTQFLTDRIISFPVKYEWYQPADLELIQKSLEELKEVIKTVSRNSAHPIKVVYIPKPGCGNGQLNWHDVRRLFKNITKKIVVVSNE